MTTSVGTASQKGKQKPQDALKTVASIIPAFFHELIAYVFPMVFILIIVLFFGEGFREDLVDIFLDVEESLGFAVFFLLAFPAIAIVAYPFGQMISGVSNIINAFHPVCFLLFRKNDHGGFKNKKIERLILGRPYSLNQNKSETLNERLGWTIGDAWEIGCLPVVYNRNKDYAPLLHKLISSKTMALNIFSMTFLMLILLPFLYFTSSEEVKSTFGFGSTLTLLFFHFSALLRNEMLGMEIKETIYHAMMEATEKEEVPEEDEED